MGRFESARELLQQPVEVPLTTVWKRSVSWLASGAAATVGLVWLTRLFRRKSAEREAWDSPPVDATAHGGEIPKSALTFPDDVEEELVAAEDARHDIGDPALDLEAEDQSEELEAPDSAETVHAQERTVPIDEPYDALDSDELGTEWLFRATESHPTERVMTPEELAERAAEEASRHKP